MLHWIVQAFISLILVQLTSSLTSPRVFGLINKLRKYFKARFVPKSTRVAEYIYICIYLCTYMYLVDRKLQIMHTVYSFNWNECNDLNIKATCSYIIYVKSLNIDRCSKSEYCSLLPSETINITWNNMFDKHSTML